MSSIYVFGCRGKEDRVCLFFLFALALIYFLPSLIRGNQQVLSSAGTDVWNQFFYWRHFGFAALARGELPLWNPYSFSGTPHVAGIQSAIFYPFNIIYLFFATAFATNLSIALHCFIASVFTYYFSRYLSVTAVGSFIAAITYTYGAPYFFHIYPGHLSILTTMTWLPLLFMGVEAFLRNRKMKYALLSGISLALAALAGHPQYLFYSLIAVTLYFVFSLALTKTLREAPYFLAGFGLLIITGLSLSAVQLSPAIELARYSVREALSYQWVSTFSLAPEDLVTLLLPDFFGDLLAVPYWGKNYLWEMSLYIGVIPLAIAIIAIGFDRSRSVVTFSLIALFSLLMALGKHTPLLSFFYSYVPGFNLFRGLSKFVFVFAFACSILAGHGITTITALMTANSPALRKFSFFTIGFSLVLVVLGLLGLLYSESGWRFLVESYNTAEDRFSPFPPISGQFIQDSLHVVLLNIIKTSVLLFGLGRLIAGAGKLKTLSPQHRVVAMAALAAFDLWLFGFRYLQTFDPAGLSMDSQLRSFLKRDKEPFRIATPKLELLNVGLLEGIENVGGYDAIVLRDYSQLINITQGFPIDEPNIVMSIGRISPLLRLLNARYYVLAPATDLVLPGFELVFQNRNYKVYQDNGALPRSFVVHSVRRIEDRPALLGVMLSPEFNPSSLAIIEEAADNLPNNPTLKSPTPRIIERSLNTIRIEAELVAAGLLVLADAYYPGWKAFVDGRESKIYRTNYAVRGVLLPPGRHSVEFRYEPLSLKMGAIVSLVSLLLLVGFIIRSKAKARAGSE